MNKGIFSKVHGEMFSGKEANIFLADGNNGLMVLKIYRVEAANFQNMRPYIVGDPRFSAPKNKQKLICEWAKKEYRNLLRFADAGIRVPKPIAFQENVLAMEFIGDEAPALNLKLSPPKNPQEMYDEIAGFIEAGVKKAKLVHADLSEYNILNHNGKPVIIDCGQSVDVRHPNAQEFFERDVKNINRFFSNLCKTRDIKWIL